MQIDGLPNDATSTATDIVLGTNILCFVLVMAALGYELPAVLRYLLARTRRKFMRGKQSTKLNRVQPGAETGRVAAGPTKETDTAQVVPGPRVSRVRAQRASSVPTRICRFVVATPCLPPERTS